jgi:tetratricopeptide (TPR) repeat protein/predicted Ser/Thr protein kinase
VVFLVRRPGDPQPFALKIHTGARDRETLIRLQLEAQIGARLDHPGIVRVCDQGLIDGRDYLLMEYCEGESLRDRLRRGALGWRDAGQVVLELARTMSVAHAQGILHRDLKPANVILEASSGRPRIIDFGLARDPSLVQSLTQSRVMLGTPLTMAPEQLRGQPDVDARADVYALGTILYWCLAGRPPFRAESVVELAHMVAEVDPDPLGHWTAGVPAAVERVCLRALAKDRAERPADAGELALELAEALEGAKGPSPRAEPSAGAGRARLAVVSLVVASVVVVLTVVLTLSLVEPSEPEVVEVEAPPAALEASPAPAPVDPAAATQRLLDEARTLARASAPLAELLVVLDEAEAAADGDRELQDRVLLARAEACRRRGDYQGAIDCAPVDAAGEVGLSARWVRGLCLLRSGRGAEADEVFEALVRDDPEGSNGLDAQAVLLIGEGGSEWARVGQRCGQANPDDVHARLMAAYGLMRLESPEAALAAIAAIGREEPDEPHVYFVTAFVHSSSGDPVGARAAWDEVLRRTAPYASHQALLGRADTFMEEEAWGHALADINRLLAIDAHNVRALLLRGLCQFLLDERAQAWETWRDAVRRRDPATWEEELRRCPPDLAEELRRLARETPAQPRARDR